MLSTAVIALVAGLAACGGSNAASEGNATLGALTPTASAPASSPASIGPEPSIAAGTTHADPGGVVQVWVPAGSFEMGSTGAQVAAVTAASPPTWVKRELPSEQPAHRVTLS